LVPWFPFQLSARDQLAYAYFAVAIVSAVMFPYETYFYSSGAIEDRWSRKDLKVNRLTTGVGFSLGSVLAMGILVSGAVLFQPAHIDPGHPGTVALHIAQFFGWTWGRYRKPADTPRFTLLWVAAFAVALAIVLTGVDPLKLVEWSVVFSIIVLPLTYLPLLLIANDRKYMGEQVNGRVSNVLGIGFYVVVLVVATAAFPLYLITSGGQK
jgi:Mn2+/Fe2+ NRAMP family transporter